MKLSCRQILWGKHYRSIAFDSLTCLRHRIWVRGKCLISSAINDYRNNYSILMYRFHNISGSVAFNIMAKLAMLLLLSICIATSTCHFHSCYGSGIIWNSCLYNGETMKFLIFLHAKLQSETPLLYPLPVICSAPLPHPPKLLILHGVPTTEWDVLSIL